MQTRTDSPIGLVMFLAQPEILESRSQWLSPWLLGAYYMGHMLLNVGEHRAKMDNDCLGRRQNLGLGGAQGGMSIEEEAH